VSSTTVWRDIAEYLRPIALVNPKLAVMLARGQPMQPQSYSMGMQFDTGGIGTPVENHFTQNQMNPALITGVSYTIWTPGWLAGSLLKPIAENARQSGPTYLTWEWRIEGPDRYTITKNPAPIESMAVSGPNSDRNLINNGWVLDYNANLYIKAYLGRAFADEELPLTLWVTINMLELSGCNLRSISYSEAVCALRKMGLYPEIDGVPHVPPLNCGCAQGG